MKSQKFREYIYWGITAVLVIVSCILVVFMAIRWDTVKAFGSKVNGILAPVTYGAILAYLLTPIYNRIRQKTEHGIFRKVKKERTRTNLAKATASTGSLVILIVVVVSLFAMVIPEVWRSIVGIVESIPAYAATISNWIVATFSNTPELEQDIMGVYNQAVTYLMDWIQSASSIFSKDFMAGLEMVVSGVFTGVMGIVNLLKNLLLGMIVMLYLLNIKDVLCAQIKKGIYGICSLTVANALIDKFRYVHKVFGGFIIGKIVDSLIIGILTFVWLSVIKMPYTLLVSVIIGVTNVIPFFGPFIGAIPSAFLILLVSPLKCFYFILSIIVIQQFDGNVLGPKILGDTTGISSFWVLFSILLFGGLFGVVGMIIAVPVFAVGMNLLKEWIERRLRKKNLDTDTESYSGLDYIDAEKKTYIR